jgi:Reverse transcriptase (RNA-dependent DNA polymerase)
VYVDDIIIIDDDYNEITQLKTKLSNEFEVKNLEQLKYFLGINVARGVEGIVLSIRSMF